MSESLSLLGRLLIFLVILFFALIKFGFVILLFGLGILFLPIDILGAFFPQGGPPSASASMFKAALELLEDIMRSFNDLDL